MNKFFRTVWSINGVLLLIILLVTGVILLKELFRSVDFSGPEIIVGEELKKAKAEGLILQGLDFDTPRAIHRTDLFLLPVSIKTFKNPKRFTKDLGIASSPSNFEGAYAGEYFNVANVIFLNKKFEPQSVLLDKKGFIESFRYPSVEDRSYGIETDTVQWNITYLIAFEDSDKDGSIDGNDKLDLFLSDLNGQNLIQITNNINIVEYFFLNRNEIVIKYRKIEDKPLEHQREYFALYSIIEKKLKDLSALHDTLDKIESLLIQ